MAEYKIPMKTDNLNKVIECILGELSDNRPHHIDEICEGVKQVYAKVNKDVVRWLLDQMVEEDDRISEFEPEVYLYASRDINEVLEESAELMEDIYNIAKTQRNYLMRTMMNSTTDQRAIILLARHMNQCNKIVEIFESKKGRIDI